jgi:hypothetical protein
LSDPVTRDLETIEAPWAKLIEMSETEYDNGFKLLRLRIREKKRITDLELDFETAKALGAKLAAWGESATPDEV